MILVGGVHWSGGDHPWCSMVSDVGVEELLAFAERLGLSCAYLRHRRLGFGFGHWRLAHFELPMSMRERALALGAVLTDDRALIERAMREDVPAPASLRSIDVASMPLRDLYTLRHAIDEELGRRGHLTPDEIAGRQSDTPAQGPPPPRPLPAPSVDHDVVTKGGGPTVIRTVPPPPSRPRTVGW